MTLLTAKQITTACASHTEASKCVRRYFQIHHLILPSSYIDYQKEEKKTIAMLSTVENSLVSHNCFRHISVTRYKTKVKRYFVGGGDNDH